MADFLALLKRTFRPGSAVRRPPAAAGRRKAAYKPELLSLEDRRVPSTLVLAPSGASATINATLGTGVQAQRDLIGTNQIGTINRTGVASTVTAPKTFPGLSVIQPTLLRTFDLYSFANPQGIALAVTVSFNCNVSDTLFIAAYAGKFNPQNIGQNYLADPGISPPGGSPTGAVTFSFTVPAHTTLILVVNNVHSGSGIGTPYTFTISPVVTPPAPVRAGRRYDR